MKIPYLNLAVNDSELKKELLLGIEKVLTHGRLILGPEVRELECKVADFCHKKYAIAVSSGTDALYLTLRCLGIQAQDEIITTPLSPIPTLNAIYLAGASPTFVDLENNFNINTYLLESSITDKTRAIMPVHYAGLMCKMDTILEIAEKYNLLVIEDASQAFGSMFKDKPAGSFGHTNCFSLNSMKILSSLGEAGIIVTDDFEVYEKLQQARYAGINNAGECLNPSLNFRMDTIQAAAVLTNFNYLSTKIERRQKIAQYYNSQLKDVVQCPLEEKSFRHTFYAYCILTDHRNELKKYLQEKGIETKIHYSKLMFEHLAYSHLKTLELSNAQKIVKKILSLPNHENLHDDEIQYIIDCIKKFS